MPLRRAVWGMALGMSAVALCPGCACLKADAATWPASRSPIALPSADASLLEGHVRTLAEVIGPRSPSQPEALVQAATYIELELSTMGYAPERQSVTTLAGRGYDNLLVRCGARGAAREGEETFVIGAHYDSHPDTPGADDNASGTAALLELARHLKGADCGALVVELVFYTLEEPPYFRTAQMGSAVHARSLQARGAEVRGMLSVEMVGYYDDAPDSQDYPTTLLAWRYPDVGNFLALIGRPSDSDLIADVAPLLAAQRRVPIYGGTAPAQVPGVDFSDHLNYWDAGFPAAMLTDTAFMRNTAYHEDNDIPSRLDYARMAKVVDGLYALAVGLSPR